MLHLNGEALRTGSPIIDVRDSMTAFVRALGIDTNGRNLRTLRDQLARLAAAHIMLGIGSKRSRLTSSTPSASGGLMTPKQRILWPSTVQSRSRLLRQPHQTRRPARQPGRRGAGALGAGPRHLRVACPTPAPHPQRQAADDHMAGAQVPVRCGICRASQLPARVQASAQGRPDGLSQRPDRGSRCWLGAVEFPASGSEEAGQHAAPQPPDHRRDRDRNSRHLTRWADRVIHGHLGTQITIT